MTSLVQVILKLAPRFITGTEDSTLYLETLCCPLLVFTQCGAYHFGNVISPAERYGAYSNLKAFDLPSSQGRLLSRIRYIMKRIDLKISETSEFDRIIAIPVNSKFRCFEAAFNTLCDQINLNRISEMSFRRLYHLFKSKGL